QVNSENPVHAYGDHHVGDHLGGDRHPCRAHATVLASVTEVGDHGGDAGCRCATQGVDHHQQFHEVVVGGCAGGLHHENVAPAHVLVQFHGDLAVAELANIGLAQGQIEPVGDFL